MTDIDTSRAAVERLLTGVTPGPWRALSNNEVWRDGFGDIGLSIFDRLATAEATFTTRMGRRHCTGEAGANARFIAAARELVPALLARAEAAEARADAAEEAHIFTDAALAAERETVARLTEALRFYANEENYKGQTLTDPCGCCSSWYEPKIHIDGEDSGGIARAALTQKDRTDD